MLHGIQKLNASNPVCTQSLIDKARNSLMESNTVTRSIFLTVILLLPEKYHITSCHTFQFIIIYIIYNFNNFKIFTTLYVYISTNVICIFTKLLKFTQSYLDNFSVSLGFWSLLHQFRLPCIFPQSRRENKKNSF